ncbi:MAG: PAS domain S-box protein [Acidobacteriota bacterium]
MGFQNGTSESADMIRIQENPLSVECMEAYLSAFPDAVAVVDSNRKLVYLNDEARRMLGCQAEGAAFYGEMLRGTKRAAPIDPIESTLSLGKGSRDIPLTLLSAGGEPLSLSATTAPIKRGDAVEGCMVILREASPPPSRFEPSSDMAVHILDNLPTALFTVDRHLTITYMNRQLEILTGCSREETVNRKTCSQVLHTIECNTDDCLLGQAMEGNFPVSESRRTIMNRKGDLVPVIVCGSTITDLSGEVVGAFETLRDISRYTEAERKMEFVTEITQEGLMLLDEHYTVFFANSKMAEILGMKKDDLIGMDARSIIVRQQQELIDDLLGSMNGDKTGILRFCTTIEPIEDSLRDYRAFETCISVSLIGKGIVIGICFRDVTPRVEVERKLRRTNNFLNNIIRSSVDGIIVADNLGKVIIFNEGAENILGYKAEELIGNREALRSICSAEVVRENMRRMRSGEYGPPGKLNTTRITFYNKAGEPVPVNFSAALIKEGEEELGSVGIFTDMRETLRIRKELEDARNQLVQSEKISSLGRLAAGVAHEINNPLAGILIFADMLLKDIGNVNPQWGADLEEIIQQTLRCKQIVTRLLEFSRQSLNQKTIYTLNGAIEQCVQLLAHQTLFHDIEIVRDLHEDLPQLVGDPSQLQQVFTNLIINSADAMRGRGKVTITSRFDAEQNRVVIRFADTGPGIPEEIINKIFEPFFTTKPPGEGTGLGLSVAHGIVQQHGGTIEARNEGGAVFVLSLPLEPPDSP